MGEERKGCGWLAVIPPDQARKRNPCGAGDLTGQSLALPLPCITWLSWSTSVRVDGREKERLVLEEGCLWSSCMCVCDI